LRRLNAKRQISAHNAGKAASTVLKVERTRINWLRLFGRTTIFDKQKKV